MLTETVSSSRLLHGSEDFCSWNSFIISLSASGLFQLSSEVSSLHPLTILLTRRDNPLIPLHLLIFAVEVAVSTYACTLEMLSWEDYSTDELKQLSALYIPYLGLGEQHYVTDVHKLTSLAILMGTDMFIRLKSSLASKSKTQ